jgi:uncharacterized repeat protein (TIGR01451 family)
VGIEDYEFKIYGNPVGLEFQFWTPTVENETYIPLTTTVTYEDIYRNKYERKFTTDVIIVPSTETFAIIRTERTDLGVIINYTNLTELGEPGRLNMELISKGYGPIEKYELKINLPNGIEVSTNDTTWIGRREAEIKRVNDTLIVLSGEISRDGNITTLGTEEFSFGIQGRVPGTYNIPYVISYDENELVDSFQFNVRGPLINLTKELSKTSAKVGEEIAVTIRVANVGNGDANNLALNDEVPGAIPIVSGNTQLSREVLRPGEELILTYNVKASSSADMGDTTVSWTDILGNSYSRELKSIPLQVDEPPAAKPPEVTKPPSVATPKPAPAQGKIFPREFVGEEARIEISSREGIGVLALTLIVVTIVFKLMTMRVPAKEEE